ncbi:MAG: ABC transporter ATP-binding protein [Gammaproteobacteria bacterium]|nr:ABC transporter ATP-binding protein [Gammaproteobacteria bacterium]
MAAAIQAVQIAVSHLGKTFSAKGRTTVAFEDLTFHINEGEFVCVLGPSGCGKTTLLRTIAGLERATQGELVIHPARTSGHADIGMVFQEHGLFPWMSVRDNIRFLLENNPRLAGRDIDAIADKSIGLVGLSGFADYLPHQLSGGMRQRVSIARSFANEPDILLMDEPFVFLDYQSRLNLQALLLNIWQRSHKTIVFVTHDIEEAVLLADRILVMHAHPGKIKTIIDIGLPRPRDVLNTRKLSAYQQHVANILELSRAEFEGLETAGAPQAESHADL